MAKYTIIGLDPASTRNIGWSVLSLDKKPSKTAKIASWEGGTFVMPTFEERWMVLWPMFVLADAFIEENKPNLIIVEKTSSFSSGPNNFVAGQVSHCMGVIFAASGKHNIGVEFVYPTSVKKLVAGYGRATKAAVKNATRQLLSEAGLPKVKFDSEHTADATANTLYWLIKNGIISPLKGEE